MSDVPSEVCYEILLRVPVVHLTRFRSVCKAWRSIIDDEGFYQMHLQGGDQLLIRHKTGTLYVLPLSSVDCSKYQTITVEMENIKNVIRPGVSRIRKLPVPSNRGLILLKPLYNSDKTVWTMWNPLTGESFQLPPHHHLTGVVRYCGCGIGYDSATSDYKVVMNAQFWDSKNRLMAHTIIYSLKLNYWKIIPNFKKPVRIYEHGVFVDGALHWLTHHATGTVCIVSLDLSTEEVHVLAKPSFLSEEQNLNGFYLDVLDGCLCLRNDRAIWIMKNYEENVWTKLVSCEQLPDMKRPIAYIKGKAQVLIQLKTAELVLFDVEKKCAKKVCVEGVDVEDFTCQVFTSTLFWRNGSRGDDGCIANKGTLKRKRKTADNRLVVELKISNIDDPHCSSSGSASYY